MYYTVIFTVAKDMVEEGEGGQGEGMIWIGLATAWLLNSPHSQTKQIHTRGWWGHNAL